MGYDDASDLLRGHLQPSKPAAQLTRPESTVQHDMGCCAAGVGGNQERVALATTA